MSSAPRSMVPGSIPRLLIAGTHSGVGKTSLCAGLVRALTRRGLRVQTFKCGPDYIDPGFHGKASGRPCHNLDSWMLSDAQVQASFELACRDADLALIEGVMGLFDGSSFAEQRASAAQIAGLLEAPILLVTDISGSGRSAAATVLGFDRFDEQTRLSGVLLNFAGSEAHARGCAGVILEKSGVPMLGWMPRRPGLAVPERKLGLRMAGETPELETLLEKLADEVESHFDLEALLRLARGTDSKATGCGEAAAGSPGPRTVSTGPIQTTLTGSAATACAGPVLAVASDEAFCFSYPENLELLRARGLRIHAFSPLRGESPPPGAAGVYLGGGYPELHAERLSHNREFFHTLQNFKQAGKPVLAECGGFMVLTEAIEDDAGRSWPMAGLVPGKTRMTDRLQSMGYRVATCLQDTLLGAKGEQLRAHEFHYSVWELPVGMEPCHAFLCRGSSANSPEQPVGWSEQALLGSYLHFHFGQNTTLLDRFVEALKGAQAQNSMPA